MDIAFMFSRLAAIVSRLAQKLCAAMRIVVWQVFEPYYNSGLLIMTIPYNGL